MRIIRLAVFVLSGFFAATASFAAGINQFVPNMATVLAAKRHKPAVTGIETLSARDLRTAGVSERIIRQLSDRKDLGGITEIPTEDFPELALHTEGTGDVRLSGTIPVPTPLPAIVLAQRGNCEDCPFTVVSAAWTQSTATGLKPARITWYRVEPTADVLNWAYSGGFDTPGLYNVKVAVLHPKYGFFMTRTFTDIEVNDVDFYNYGCVVSENSQLTFEVQSLGKIANGSLVSIDIPGIGVKTGTTAVAPKFPRQAQVIITVPVADYANIAGTLPLVTLTVAGRSRTKATIFFPMKDQCGVGKG